MTTTFNSWIATKLKERANVQKQARLYREEFDAIRGNGNKGRVASAVVDVASQDSNRKSKTWRRRSRRGGGYRIWGWPALLRRLSLRGQYQDLPTRAQNAMRSLCRLAGYKFDSLRLQQSHRPRTAVREHVVAPVIESIAEAGDRPEDMSDFSMLQDMMRSNNLYETAQDSHIVHETAAFETT